MGKIFVTGDDNPGRLYRIDPSAPAGAVTTVASNLGVNAEGVAGSSAPVILSEAKDLLCPSSICGADPSSLRSSG